MIHWKYGMTCHRAKTATFRLLFHLRLFFSLWQDGYGPATITPSLGIGAPPMTIVSGASGHVNLHQGPWTREG